MEDSYPFCEGDVCCFHTATTFVDSIWQMLGPLLGGIPCLVLPPEISRNPTALVQALIRHSVTHFVAVPRLLRNILPVMERSNSRGEHFPHTNITTCCVIKKWDFAPSRGSCCVAKS